MTNKEAIQHLLPEEHAQWVIDRWDEDLNGYYMDDEYDPTDPTILMAVLEWNESNSNFLCALDNYFQYKSESYFYGGEAPLPKIPKPIKPQDVEVGKLFKIAGDDCWYLRTAQPVDSLIIAVPYPMKFGVVGIIESIGFEVTQIKDAPLPD
jgi:hypothetical protein